MAISGCGLVILVTSVRERVVARTDGLHLIRQSQVVANDIAKLVSRVRIVVHIYWKLHLTLRIVVRNSIVPHMYQQVMAYILWNHELWLMATKDILRSSSKVVKHGGTWWCPCC